MNSLFIGLNFDLDEFSRQPSSNIFSLKQADNKTNTKDMKKISGGIQLDLGFYLNLVNLESLTKTEKREHHTCSSKEETKTFWASKSKHIQNFNIINLS